MDEMKLKIEEVEALEDGERYIDGYGLVGVAYGLMNLAVVVGALADITFLSQAETSDLAMSLGDVQKNLIALNNELVRLMGESRPEAEPEGEAAPPA